MRGVSVNDELRSGWQSIGGYPDGFLDIFPHRVLTIGKIQARGHVDNRKPRVCG